MEYINSFNLDQLQEEIQPLLNEALNNSPNLKEVLEKYRLLEAAELQLKLNTNSLGVQEIELRNSNQSQIRLNINRFNVQAFDASCCRWCSTCDNWRQCGDCPADPNQC